MHQSVLLQEALNGLNIKPQGIYFDATFGRGGHSQAILDKLDSQGRLFALDKDAQAVAYAQEHFGTDGRFKIIHDSFAAIAEHAKACGVAGAIDGILLDLGVSSPQLDDPTRGFSFLHDGPLDMRMNATQGITAAQFIKESSVEHMTQVFKEYGEERFAKRIAQAIEEARRQAPITTTLELAEIVKKANPKWEKHKHPATRVFQAIRIYVNQELSELQACLEQCVAVLGLKGRLVVISFHSLEDRIVKQFMRSKEQGATRIPKEIPVPDQLFQPLFKRVGKALMPTDEEVRTNKRARSAVLRIGEKQV